MDIRSFDPPVLISHLANGFGRSRLSAVVLVMLWAGVCAGAAEDRSGADRMVSPLWRVPGEGRGLPAVAGATAYFLSKRHEVVAVDRFTGGVRWRQRTGGPGDSTLGSAIAVAGEIVAAGDHAIVGFDRLGGGVRWRFTPPDGSVTGPYLGSSARGVLFTGSTAGGLYAIDPADGRMRWSLRVADNSTVFHPLADEDLVVAGYTTFDAPRSGGLIAADVRNGQERWRFAFGGSVPRGRDSGWAGGPLLVDDLVIAASADGTIHGVDRRTGERRWTLASIESHMAREYGAEGDFRALSRSGRRLFAGSLTGQLTAFDLDTRQQVWRYRSSANGGIGFRLASDDRSVYVPFVEGCLVAVNVSDGRERWRTRLDGGFHWPPLVDRDRLLLAASVDGFLAFPRE